MSIIVFVIGILLLAEAICATPTEDEGTHLSAAETYVINKENAPVQFQYATHDRHGFTRGTPCDDNYCGIMVMDRRPAFSVGVSSNLITHAPHGCRSIDMNIYANDTFAASVPLPVGQEISFQYGFYVQTGHYEAGTVFTIRFDTDQRGKCMGARVKFTQEHDGQSGFTFQVIRTTEPVTSPARATICNGRGCLGVPVQKNPFKIPRL